MHKYYHSCGRSPSPVLMAINTVNEKGQFLTTYLMDGHPSTDHRKICHRCPYSCAKFGAYPFTERAFWRMGEI